MRPAPVCALMISMLLAACGGSSKSTSSSATPTSTGVLEVAGPTPSASAKMVCAPEAQSDIAAAIGLDAAKVTPPKWNVGQHILSCDYDYGAGSTMTLSIKELSSSSETAAYFDALATRLGVQRTLAISQGAYQTNNGSLIVRKDYKVLLIDVTHLPAQFGSPPTDRADIAINVGTVIMACWNGS